MLALKSFRRRFTQFFHSIYVAGLKNSVRFHDSTPGYQHISATFSLDFSYHADILHSESDLMGHSFDSQLSCSLDLGLGSCVFRVFQLRGSDLVSLSVLK